MHSTTAAYGATDLRISTKAAPATRTLADEVVARSADVTFLLEIESTVTMARWYDAAHSKLALPDESEMQELIEWVHPDDLLEVIEAFAAVVNGRPSGSAMARLHPDRSETADGALLIRIQDIRDVTGSCALIQAWVVDAQGDDSILRRQFDSSRSLSSLAAAAPVGLQVLGPQGKVSFENERFTRLAALARPEIDGLIAVALTQLVEVTEDLRAGDTWLRLRLVPTLEDDGRLVLAVASLEDVSQVQVAEARRKQAENLFEAVFDSLPVATALVGLDGTLHRVNEPIAVILGYPASQLLGMRLQHVTHPADLHADDELLAEVIAGGRPSYVIEKRYLHRAGHEIWVALNVAPVLDEDGTVAHLVVHLEDVTTRRSALHQGDEDDLTYWATHDHLTTLPNRRFVEHHLQVSLARARRASDPRPVVMFLDLDDFKPVNDQFGHEVGDEVLQAIARRLQAACRDEAVAARYGGDEFVVVAHRLRSVVDVPVLAERLCDAVRTPITSAAGHVLTVGVSLGISIARPSESAAEVMSRADAAAYRAKKEGKDRAFFAP